MKAYQRAVLKAALDDIDNLAAPQNVDGVCGVLSVDLVEFVKLGRVGMRAVVLRALEGVDIDPTSSPVETPAPDAASALRRKTSIARRKSPLLPTAG